MKIVLSLFVLSLTLVLAASSNPFDDLAESKARGEEAYTMYCITCHMGEGEGVKGTNPPLAKSDYLLEDVERAIRIVKYGQQGEIIVNGETYNSYMAPLGLDDMEVADVMNYILNSWGNSYDKMITEEQVAAIEE